MNKNIIIAMVAIAAITGIFSSCTSERQTTESIELIQNSIPSVSGAIDMDASCANIQSGIDTVRVVGAMQFGPTNFFFALFFSNGVCGFFDPTNKVGEYINMKYNSPLFVNEGDSCVIKTDVEQKTITFLENLSKKNMVDEINR